MHNVRVERTGLTNEKVAEVLRHQLGAGTRAEARGLNTIELRKGVFERAHVEMRQEGDSTVFTVRGQGLPVPLLVFTLRYLNDRGIAKRAAQALQQIELPRGEA